jgi:cytochrome c553
MILKLIVVRVRSLAIILGLLALPVSADETRKRIAEQGTSQGAAPCLSCHGPDGAGNAAAGFPRLAGLNAAYLERQLHSYHSMFKFLELDT